MLSDGLDQTARVFVAGVLAYVGLVVFLRMSGKRTLAKMNAYDFVVTVALGSSLSSALLSESVATAEALAAFATLILAQFAVAWLIVRSPGAQRMLTSKPRTLVRDGVVIEEALRAERIGRDQVLSAVRKAGVGGLDQVCALVLETDGELSVITAPVKGDGSAIPE